MRTATGRCRIFTVARTVCAPETGLAEVQPLESASASPRRYSTTHNLCDPHPRHGPTPEVLHAVRDSERAQRGVRHGRVRERESRLGFCLEAWDSSCALGLRGGLQRGCARLLAARRRPRRGAAPLSLVHSAGGAGPLARLPFRPPHGQPTVKAIGPLSGSAQAGAGATAGTQEWLQRPSVLFSGNTQPGGGEGPIWSPAGTFGCLARYTCTM